MQFSRVLSVVDCHAEGESGKVIVGGIGQIPGETMFDKREFLRAERDDIRRLVLLEPRGAVWHNANILLPSHHPDADMGFVIDLYGLFYNLKPLSGWEEFAARLGTTADVLRPAFSRYRPDYDANFLDIDQYWRLVGAELGIEIDPRAMGDAGSDLASQHVPGRMARPRSSAGHL